MKPTLKIAGTIALVVSFAGCRYEPPKIGRPAPAPASTEVAIADPAAAAQPPATIPPGHPPVPGLGAPGTPAPAAGVNLLNGEVLETMDAAGYTYLRVKTAKVEFWAAVRQTKIAKGDNVAIVPQMTMTDFESKTLGRKFDSIIFGTLAGAPNMATGAAPATMPPDHPMPGAGSLPGMGAMGGGASKIEPGAISVAKAEGPGGHTVAEIWAARAELKDKTVTVHGKVVKFLPEIMGANWIHLQDGTGARENNTHDITVTTKEKLAAGDVVVVTGTVRTDVVLGAGYSYPVMIENATVTK